MNKHPITTDDLAGLLAACLVIAVVSIWLGVSVGYLAYRVTS